VKISGQNSKSDSSGRGDAAHTYEGVVFQRFLQEQFINQVTLLQV
jgi:hypothetical protein